MPDSEELSTPDPVINAPDGFRAIPTAFTRCFKHLQLDSAEILILYAVATFQKDPLSIVICTRTEIMEFTQLSASTVDRRRESLITKKLLISLPMIESENDHTFTGIALDIRPLWEKVSQLTGVSWTQMFPKSTIDVEALQEWQESVYDDLPTPSL
jgi:hypothetical protein